MWFDVGMASTTTHSERRFRSITKPGYVYVACSCSRCGGSGIYSPFHGTCWRCGGNGQDPVGQRTYGYPADWTDEQIVDHVAKRRAAAEKRAAAKVVRDAAKAKEDRARFVAAFPQVPKILKRYADQDEFVADLARQFEQRGHLSDRQVEVLMAKPEAIKARQKRDAEDAKRRAEATPCPNGTEILTGEVATTRWQDSDYGSTLKMLLIEDRGFKVWGSVPKGLDVKVGDRVRFTAAVESSTDDVLFGFFKRPRKAEALDGPTKA